MAETPAVAKSNTDIYKNISNQIGGTYSHEQVAILHKSVAKGTTVTELAYFLNVCQSQGLNPINKEIWCYKDGKGNVIIFASKDGWYKKAQEHANFNGIRHGVIRENDDWYIDQPNGEVECKITKSAEDRGKILYGWSKVFLKDGTEHVEIVDFATYNKAQFVWKSHPESMIMKVADTHAIKFALGFSQLQIEEDFDISHKAGKTIIAPLNSTPAAEVLEPIDEENFKNFMNAGAEYVRDHQNDWDFTDSQKVAIDLILN